jgi:4-amino-4-deoxy-L-arabinose transferase-like glycosyltransferase
MKKTSVKKPGQPWIYIVCTVVLFVVAFSYIFNSKIDLNGDNCDYYLLATSLSGGHGYSDITNDAYRPTNVFPPGYPLLMSSIRIFTDSFFLQKVLNGLFLLASALLLFFFIRKNKLPDSLAFIAVAIVLLNYQVLHFATMMMSEMSFLLFSALSLFFLARMDDEKPFWKDRYFYFAILSTAYCYHIRTQGIALAAAVLGFFLFTKKWKQMLAFACGFAVCLIPWILRNKMLNLGQSRYLDTISMANPWRPEEGALSIGEVITRFLDTFKMLITQAVPNSILPYFSIDYSAPVSWGGWITAIILLGIIGIGMVRFGKQICFYFLYAGHLGCDIHSQHSG